MNEPRKGYVCRVPPQSAVAIERLTPSLWLERWRHAPTADVKVHERRTVQRVGVQDGLPILGEVRLAQPQQRRAGRQIERRGLLGRGVDGLDMGHGRVDGR